MVVDLIDMIATDARSFVLRSHQRFSKRRNLGQDIVVTGQSELRQIVMDCGGVAAHANTLQRKKKIADEVAV